MKSATVPMPSDDDPAADGLVALPVEEKSVPEQHRNSTANALFSPLGPPTICLDLMPRLCAS